MSDFSAELSWMRKTTSFDYDSYDRNHDLAYGSGLKIVSSAAPEFKGDGTKVNPEEALLGSIMSCHMLTFLAIASKKHFTVDQYEDSGTAILSKNSKGMLFVSEARLNPRITFSDEKKPSPEQLRVMHEKSHHNCFIANSVLTKIYINGETFD
jgi:organic hydroperoxide reductase OsmC/OhrA